MTQRDRAWRRRVTRVVDHREELTKQRLGNPQPDADTPPLAKQHQHGKLTQVQSKRLDWQLRGEAEYGWSGDAPIQPPPPPEHGLPTVADGTDPGVGNGGSL